MALIPKIYRNQPLDIALMETHCQQCDERIVWEHLGPLSTTKPPVYVAMCNCSEWEMIPKVANIVETKRLDFGSSLDA